MIAPAILLALATQQPQAPYWQQRLEYDITASLDEGRGVLGGTQQVVYHNNSPDTLRTVSFHLYLNAFRPGSRWADVDSAEKRRRFNDLKDPDFAFNHVRDVTVDGQAVSPVYPLAPDSTIVRFTLPRPIGPGGSFTVRMNWDARPSTVPRRQGRRGRAFDFAQWYPRVVAYDKYGWEEHALYPAGEFYGDFGDFRVQLDVPEDQVVGATGVPVCGDPGWERANADRSKVVEYQREFYGPVLCDNQGPRDGRKTILWVAKDVHHFAMSMNPAYKHEGGRFNNVAVHVLYQPGDERSWGNGVAVRNTETALRWLDGLFGAFPWPQLTNVHRIEGGGTEFPMMVHDGSAGLGLILHEVGHNYLMGILASNEWREGYLDEGFTSFQTTWFAETQGNHAGYPGTERGILLSDVDDWSEPTSLQSEQYRDFSTYNSMIYDRGELFYHQLRTIVGDSTMREILRTYYQRWKLKHVDEAAFRAVAEEVSHRNLAQFFGQWLHSTALYDYELGRVRTSQSTCSSGPCWVTRAEVRRKAPGMFPVDVMVRSKTDSAKVRAIGTAEREWVTVATTGKPVDVEIDPRTLSHDWNVLNNRKRRGLFGFGHAPRSYTYLDKVFSQPTRRDRMTIGLMPVVWFNDESGVVIGGRMRTDYLGRYQQGELYYTVNTRLLDDNHDQVGFQAVLRNPTWLRMPRTTQRIEAYSIEGRDGAAIALERQTNDHRSFGAQTFRGASVRWLTTSETDFLNPALWDAGATVEANLWVRSSERRGPWAMAGRLRAGFGVEYRNRTTGLTTEDAYDVQPYLRLFAEGTARRAVGKGWSVGLRGYAGWAESGTRPLKQRQLFVSAADPYEQFQHPLLRSRGSILAGTDVHYAIPGGGGVRGLAAGVTATRLVSVNGELERSVLTRSRAKLFREIRIAAFADAAVGNGDLPPDNQGAAFVLDAGPGIRIDHRIGQTSLTTRFDFPLLVTRGRLAVNAKDHAFAFRWVLGSEAAF